MEVAKERDADDAQTPTQNQLKVLKGKSCKGSLYYSSVLKSKSRNPLCFGLTDPVQAHGYLIGEAEMEASREGRSFTDFRYGCLGYSIYFEANDSTNELDKNAELPICVGIELILQKRDSTASHAPSPSPATAHHKEDNHAFPRPQIREPNPFIKEFLNRFARNASLVAFGVAKNLQRAGMHIKGIIDDKRPK